LKRLLNDVSVSSVFIAIIGLILIIMPSLTNRIIVYGIGIALLIYGIGRIIRYMKRDAAYAMVDHDMSAGLICIVSGLFMLLYSSVVIRILPYLFGLFLIFGGARSIQAAFDVRRFHGAHWKLHLVVGVIFIFFGFEAIRNPFGYAKLLTRFVGTGLLLLGIYRFLSNRRLKELRSEFMSEPDIIDQDSVKR